MIKVNNISLFLGENNSPLTISNLEIKKGLWSLVGRNGSGKSTFLNCLITNDGKHSDGIEINGKGLRSYKPLELSKTIAIVYNKVEVFGRLKGIDVLNLGRLPYQNLLAKMTTEDKKVVNEVIKQLGLETISYKYVDVLSDGEKQLLMIGRALVQNTPILLLDEPTAFLDVVNRKKIVKLLSQIASDKLVIFSTHNIDLIPEFCDGLLMIEGNCLNQINEKSEYNEVLDRLFSDEV